MDFNVDPSWVVLKNALSEVVCVLTPVFSPSYVEKPVPPLELVLVFKWSFGVEYFHFDPVGLLRVMENFASGAGMCLFARCVKSDWLRFLLHLHRTIKEASSGGISSFKLCIQLHVADNILWLFLVNQMPLVCTVRYLWFILCQLWACITAYIYSGQVMDQYTNHFYHDDPIMCGCHVFWTIMRVPGGAIGDLLKYYGPKR